MSKHIMIVTGEASGDLHGARLLQSIAEIHPDYTFAGMGGTALGNAGMEILYDADRVSVVGIHIWQRNDRIFLL